MELIWFYAFVEFVTLCLLSSSISYFSLESVCVNISLLESASLPSSFKLQKFSPFKSRQHINFHYPTLWNWLQIAMKLAPDRKKFMEVIGGSGEINADMEKFCTTFAPFLAENHNFLVIILYSIFMACVNFPQVRSLLPCCFAFLSLYRLASVSMIWRLHDDDVRTK